MAKKIRRKRDVVKKKKKDNYTIIAPDLFKSKVLGETKAETPEKLLGRKVKATLSEISGEPRAHNIQISLKIINTKSNQAQTEMSEYKIVPSYIKRMVRAGRSRIDLSFASKSKDGIKIQLKPIILTRHRAQKSIRTALRKKAQEIINETLSKTNYTEFCSKVITKRIQRALSSELKKIYPTGIVDLRVMKKLD